MSGRRVPRLHCPKSPACFVTFADDEHLDAEVVNHLSRAHGEVLRDIENVIASMEEVK